MSDISQVNVNNTIYDIKDATARNSLGYQLYAVSPALSDATGTCRLWHDKASNTIRGYLSIYRLNQSWGTLDAMFTIPTAIRPSTDRPVTLMVESSDGTWYPTTGYCKTNGQLRQSLTQNCIACYGAFEYRI